MRKYIAVPLFFLSAFAIQAQNFTNGQAARAEIGQYTFTFGGATPGLSSTIPNQQILGGLSGLAWKNGVLYVADSNRLAVLPQDNRVVMFNTGLIPAPTADLTTTKSYSTYNCNLCAFPAFNQLGQPQFTGSLNFITTPPDAFPPGTPPTQSNMRQPTAVATDGNILAVADTDNNRVLLWNSIPTVINQPADIVLGQADFTHAVVPNVPSASSLLGPQGVWIQDGRLFVADTQNYRILIWNHIPASNGQPADVVLGQAGFNTGTQAACDPTKANNVSAANILCNPVSVTSDGTHVFVADLGFNRVLIWNSIPSANGQNADVVVGQPDMVSTVANNPAGCLNTGTQVQCDVNLNFPRYALSDGTRLFVADGGNDRVLIFNTIPTQNGAHANTVLGQPSFQVDNVSSQNNGNASTAVDTTSAVDVTPTPTSLAFDGSNLYVSDPLDNRVLVFTPGNTLLPGNSVVNWASEIIRQEGVVSVTGTFSANDTVTVTIGTTKYAYTVQKNDTLDLIAQGLVKLINANNGDTNAIAIFAGTGSGAVYLSSKALNLGFDAIAFSVATSNTTTGTAKASGNGFLSAGTAATGSLGMLVEINGTNLSDLPTINPATAALTGIIPTSLGGAQVFMDGVATPVYSASATRVVSQIPYNLAGRNSTSVFVRTTHADGSVTVTNTTPVYIAAANPGLFDAPAQPNQTRPWPATGAFHQPGNPQAVIDITGTVNAGDIATVKIGSASYNYTVVASDTLASIVTGVVNAINNGNDPSATAQPGAAFNRVVVVAKQSGAAGNGIAIAASVSSGAKIALTPYTNQTCCNVLAGSPLTATNPAAPGETITLSAAGLGQVADLSGNVLADISTGGPFTGNVTNTATNSVSATIGATGATAQVVGAGLPQGSYGIYQVQIIVPQDQASNAVTPVSIAQNAFISNIVTIPVGAANSNPNVPPAGPSTIKINIDNPPAQGPALTGVSSVAGWAIEANTAINTVEVSIDGVTIGAASYGGNRPDVCAAQGQSPGCPNVGFNYALDTTQFADGPHTVGVTVTDANGARLTHGASFTSSNYGGANPTTVVIDSPGAKGGSFQGLATFSGWAVNSAAAISSITVSVDGVARGNANYGSARPDVCALAGHSGSPGCPNIGWSYSIDTSSLSNGAHTFAVTATAANGERTIKANPFTVANWTTANPIILNIDNPNAKSGPLSGAQHLGGWAVDPLSSIASLSVMVDGIPVGNASYGGNRPDACAGYAAPGCPRVGWDYILDTTLIPDGTHTLALTATPVSGQAYTQTLQIQVANLSGNGTLISIDTPSAQSAPVSGYTAFGGWALNENAAIGSVQISIDGIFSGYASYGGVRNDVCAVHTGRPGCPNVGWNYFLDTVNLTNGTHTVEATGTASNGQRATVSSIFTVSNTTGVSPTSVSIAQPSAASSPYQGAASFSGSAVSASSTISSIFVSIDGFPYGAATYSLPGGNAPVPWTYQLNTAQLVDGTHTFGITAVAADGTFSVSSASFQVANWTSPSPIRVNIDTPNSSSSPFVGYSAFGGWAFDPNAAIASVQIAIDGVSYGVAQYGGTRADVCAAHGNVPGCPGLGWNFAVDSTFLANGTHTLAVTAITSAGQSATMSSSFGVGN